MLSAQPQDSAHPGSQTGSALAPGAPGDIEELGVEAWKRPWSTISLGTLVDALRMQDVAFQGLETFPWELAGLQ
jgi:hypothetical protein